VYVTAQILREIMQRAARRADGGGFVFQAEAVERRNLDCSFTVKNAVSGAKRPSRRNRSKIWNAPAQQISE